MSYTQINSFGSSFKRLKALKALGIPFGPDLPTDLTAADGLCLFVHTDEDFNNGVWKWWDGSQWIDLNDPDRYGEATSDPLAPNDYQVTFSPPMNVYNEGSVLKIKFPTANTGTATLEPGTLPTREIVLPGGASLSGGELKAGGIHFLFVTDTKLQLIGGAGGSSGGGDMTKSIYDPTGINADAFDWNNFTNKPTIPSAQVNSDWSAVGGVAEILNKPTIPTIDPNTTIQGNTFNGADQLVKFGSDGKYPPGDGSQITGLPTEIIWLTDESFRPTVGVTDKAYVSKATGIIYRYDTVSGSYKVIGGGEGTPFMTATGTNTYIVTNTSAVTAYPKAVYMAFQNANTGVSTIKIDALPTLPLKVSGGDMPPNTVLAGAVKLLTLAPDSSHYQVQAGNIEVPAVPSGEKVLTKKSDGIHADYDLADPKTLTATTGANLESQNWSAGIVSYTGKEGERRLWNGYLYYCSADGTWIRMPYNLFVTDYMIGSLDDSSGVKTSIQMLTLYPAAITLQIVKGTAGVYQYLGANIWFYFENKIAV